MASTSTLSPDNFPAGRDRSVNKGHGTAALGPSDSSDSGSDVVNAGPDLGDADLDSDSDRNGTGERGAATRDTAIEGADISADHIIEEGDEEEEEE
jgi:hypothetical protein